MPEADRRPELEWERALWLWFLRLQRAQLMEVEPQAMPGGVAFVSRPHALDRSAWWPVIAHEGWDARDAMTLLERIECALYDPIEPDTAPEDDDE